MKLDRSGAQIGWQRRRRDRREVTRWRRPVVEQLEGRQLLAGDADMSLAETPVPSPIDNIMVPAAAAPSNDLVEQKIESFKAYFDAVMATEHARFLGLSMRGATDAIQLYDLQLALDGVLSMYEATGDREDLDKAILYSSNVMDSAHVIEGGWYEADGFLDWEATSGGQPLSRRQGFLLYDFQIGSALSRLASIIHEDERLQGDPAIQEFGGELTRFVDRQIVYKWLDARKQRGWLEDFHDANGYWTDKATHAINICHNLFVVLGDRSSCAGIEVELARQFRDLLVVQDDGAYLWDIWGNLPSGFNHLAPDTAHENRTAIMIAQLGADEFVFDRKDILRLGKTLTERIWNGRTDWEDVPGIEDSPWFHNYIDGSDAAYRDIVFSLHGPEGMDGFAYDGWVRLGQFVPEVQQAGEALLAFIQAFGGSVNAIHRRNGSAFGKVALAGHLAKNLRFAQIIPGSPVGAPDNARNETLGVAADVADTPSAAIDVEKQPRAGDANRDGTVTFSDFLVLSSHFGATNRIWDDGDFNGDGAVTLADFTILATNF